MDSLEWQNKTIDSIIESTILAERERCEEIVQMARSGELDGDFRTIAHLIRNGTTIEEIKSWEARWR